MKSVIAGAWAPLLLASVLGGSALAQPAAGGAAAGVRVEGGLVFGVAGEDGITSYKGIPFAAPPVRELRWRPPQPVVAWDGTRAATEFGASCSQDSRLGPPGKTSEDCLYLNIYTSANARSAPVMVWIYGGSNLNGAGADYDGAAFAKEGIVTVMVNYRLGALGFFAHPEITRAASPSEGLANYGLMDQTAALKWVQKNIVSFGGDPKNVTVFGVSAGAIDIYALLGLRTSKGLFNRAIMESNITWGDSLPLAEREQAGKALAIRAGASETATLGELKAIPAEKLVAANSERALWPVVDGRFMSETPLQAVANGHVVDVPLIIGTNSFEASLIAANEKDPQKLTDWTNAMAGAPARFIAARTAGGKPTWLYFFSYVASERRATAPGAGHGTEVPYVFGGRVRPESQPTPKSDEDKAMTALIHSCWVAFAKTGIPKCAAGPAWPRYDPKTDQLMEFGVASGVRTNFRKAELDTATAAEFGTK